MGSAIKDFLSIQAGFWRWLWKPTKNVLTPILYSAIYGTILYIAGWLLRSAPTVEVALNNGFYSFGVNVQYQFAEFFSAIGVFISLVTGIAVSTANIYLKPRSSEYVSQIPLKEEEVWKPKANIDDITGNLQLVNLPMANTLNKAGIYDIVMLSNEKPQRLVQLLKIAPTLANQIIQEAQETLTDWRRDGLIS